MNLSSASVRSVAAEVLAAYDAKRPIAPFSRRDPPMSLMDAYAVAADVRRLRSARGERPAGRKIGFTNRVLWTEFGVGSPIWGDMYDTTIREVTAACVDQPINRFLEPRIEPEIVLGLGRAPDPGMDEAALLGCVAWVAHGLEIVQSLFPGWVFEAPDTVIGLGLHGALLLGPKQPVNPAHESHWMEGLTHIEVSLARDGETIDHGYGRNALGGSLSALRHVIRVLDVDPHNPPLAAGEIITTGTLTRAFPIAAGETWSTRVTGLPLQGLSVRFV